LTATSTSVRRGWRSSGLGEGSFAVSELKLGSSTLLEQAAEETQSSFPSFMCPSSTEVSSHGGLTGFL
jgi:hypothetical protein